MSLNAIVYNHEDREFSFNGLLVGVRQVRTIAQLLEEAPTSYRTVRSASGKRSRRKEGRYATIGQYYLTANYLRQMLAFVDQNGWFVDKTDVGVGDHDFNPNVPTPGTYWARSRELKRAARECLNTADLLAGVDRTTERLLRERAAVMQREAVRLSTVEGARPRQS